MDQKLLIVSCVVVVAFLVSAIFFRYRAARVKLPISLVFLTSLVIIALFIIDLAFEDLGFASLFNGFLWALAIAAISTLVLIVASRITYTRKFFYDARTINTEKTKLLYRVFVDVPISTVLLEELFFRGFLYGFLQSAYGTLEAVMVSSILFGLWHILPSLSFSEENEAAPAKIPTIIGTVCFTTLSGVIFCLLLIWSGSILAPIALHYAVNSASLIMSWLVTHKR